MVASKHGRHAVVPGRPVPAVRHHGRPVLAVLAVVALVLGGWLLLGRGGGVPADPGAPAARSGETSPASDPLAAPADRASRDTDRAPVAAALGALAPVPPASTPAGTATTG